MRDFCSQCGQHVWESACGPTHAQLSHEWYNRSFPGAILRTAALDKHWAGSYYCMTCMFYTGQPDFHLGHQAIYLAKCEHEQNYAMIIGEGY